MSKETIILTKPLKVNGKDYKELNYDIEEIGIAQITNAEAEKTKMLGKNAPTNIKVAQADFLLHTMIGFQAIIICHPEISVEDLKRITGYDLTQIAMVGTRFFISPDAQAQESSEEPQDPILENTTVQ